MEKKIKIKIKNIRIRIGMESHFTNSLINYDHMLICMA